MEATGGSDGGGEEGTEEIEEIEVSVHQCPPSMANDMRLVFPSLGPTANRLLIVPTFQRAGCDLLGTGRQPEDEKNRLLQNVRPLSSSS